MTHAQRWIVLGLFLSAGIGGHVLQAADDDVAQLLNKVEQIPVIGAPGAVIPFGPRAFPLIVGHNGEAKALPVVAAARLGKGRIVAFSHNGYFTKPTGDWLQLVQNSLEWAGAEKHDNQPGKRRVLVHHSGLFKALQDGPHHVTADDANTWRQRLKECDVFCIDTDFDNKPELVEPVRKFVEAGGGLVTAGTGWGWVSLNEGKNLVDDYLGNRILVAAGLVVSDQMPNGTARRYGVVRPPPQLASAWEAFAFLKSDDAKEKKGHKDDVTQATHVLQAAIRALPTDDKILWPELRTFIEQTRAVPLPNKPITEKDHLARIAVAIEDAELLRLPPEKVTAHPAAVGFPFEVPNDTRPKPAKRSIDTNVPAWHSLGLYAAPGALITVTTPAKARGAKLAVRIGCHSDQLWHLAKWERWPNVCRQTKMHDETTRIANPFGGLVYVDVPKNCPLGTIQIKVEGAIESPFYVLGKTDLAEWKDKIRKLPGPWAELACDGVIVTVPSHAIRELDDPQALMEFWDKAVALQDTLAMYKKGDRQRPERFVADQQISAGYMHSGYPIMCGHDMYEYNVSIPKLRGTPTKPGGWGQWHELGHNHQQSDWTPAGTGEVTVNLFSMYVIHQHYGVPLAGTRPENLSPERRQAAMKKYLESKRDPTNWDPFEGLVLYFQLIDAFGWEPLQRVIGEYRQLGNQDHPKSDVEKWDQWMVRYSKNVNRNLGPFFVKWKVPVTEKALESIRSLPAWMHDDFEALKK